MYLQAQCLTRHRFHARHVPPDWWILRHQRSPVLIRIGSNGLQPAVMSTADHRWCDWSDRALQLYHLRHYHALRTKYIPGIYSLGWYLGCHFSLDCFIRELLRLHGLRYRLFERDIRHVRWHHLLWYVNIRLLP